MKIKIKFLVLISVLLLSFCICYNKKIYYSIVTAEKSMSIYRHAKKVYTKFLKKQLIDRRHIKNISIFNRLILAMKYSEYLQSGQYKLIIHNINYLQVLRILFKGNKMPVRVIINKIRLKKELSEQIEKQLCLNSEELMNKLNDPLIANSLGFDTMTVLVMFIPNTYNLYWNTSVNDFFKRMKLEYNRFWDKDRLKKAYSLSLSPIEVSILASIVEEESNLLFEYPIIAGLYINRLKKGMLLQADPTVKFALKNFTLKRILLKDLKVNSPYNTYKNYGLPPGPIRIPSIAAIEGVLNYTHHDYLYMCAKEDLSGSHYFEKSLGTHSIHVQKYRAKLNQLNIFQTKHKKENSKFL